MIPTIATLRQHPLRRQRLQSSPTDSLYGAIAAVTAWLDDDDDAGRRIAARCIDHDPVGFLDAMAALWVVVADVTDEGTADREQPSVPHILQGIALGVAQADVADSESAWLDTAASGHTWHDGSSIGPVEGHDVGAPATDDGLDHPTDEDLG